MNLDNETELAVVLVALGRCRAGMPDPELCDKIAQRVELALGPKAGRLYEMAQTADMGSSRSQMIHDLVNGGILAPSEPLSAQAMLARVEAGVKARKFEAWWAGRHLDANGVQTDNVDPDVAVHDFWEQLPPGQRQGPRLSRFLKHFDNIQAHFEDFTGIPAEWCLWQFDHDDFEFVFSQRVEAREAHALAVAEGERIGEPHRKMKPGLVIDNGYTSWFVDVQPNPALERVTFHVTITDPAAPTMTINQDGLDILSRSMAYQALADYHGTNTEPTTEKD